MFLLYKSINLHIICVGAKFRRGQRSWSWDDRGRYRNLQRKSKPELGVLRQDPPMLKSVLCFNRNRVLE